MKSAGSVVTMAAFDREMIRDTLSYLHRTLGNVNNGVILPSILEWANSALRTLVGFNASLKSLGFETEYFVLVADYEAMGEHLGVHW